MRTVVSTLLLFQLSDNVYRERYDTPCNASDSGFVKYEVLKKWASVALIDASMTRFTGTFPYFAGSARHCRVGTKIPGQERFLSEEGSYHSGP